MFTVFNDGVIATESVKVPPEVSETSYPVGAVMVRSENKSVAETVKLCSAETTPEQVVKALSVPEVDIVGRGGKTSLLEVVVP